MLLFGLIATAIQFILKCSAEYCCPNAGRCERELEFSNFEVQMKFFLHPKGLRMDNLVPRLVDCIHNSKVYEDKEAVKQEQEEAKSQGV